MIYGRIISKVDTDFKAYTICTAFIETDSKAHHSVIAANALNQFLNLEQELGVLIGSNEGRSIVLVFTGLDKCDFFQNIAAVYLFSMQISIELCCQNIVQVLSQHSASVSSIVLIEGHRRYLISCLEKASNIHILPLTDEQYVINDLLVHCESDAICQEAMSQFIENPESYETISTDIIDSILRDISGYPKPIGISVNIFQQNTQRVMHILPIEKIPKNQLLKPKNPVTAFNFYSSVNRHLVAAEYGNSISNNELNKELGKRWKDMCDKEKQPYNRMSHEDKKRYKKDLERMKKEAGSSNRVISKPLTSYNHFVHQEKQFVCGLSLNNAQTITGKHGGDRWSSMHPDEKRAYEVLREVEVLEYQNQF